MSQPRTPSTSQRRLIKRAGLDPNKWFVVKENDFYLYLVDKGMEQRENIMIDKATGEAVTKRMP